MKINENFRLPELITHDPVLNDLIVEVICTNIQRIPVVHEQSQSIETLTDISNQLTILQNYVSFEFGLSDRPFM